MHLVKAIFFFSSHLLMLELDDKEYWVPKNWCSWTVVLEKTLESPLGCNEIKSVNPKENQSWIFIGRANAEAPILWPLDAKNWLTGKDPEAGKQWRQEEKRMTEDEIIRWHHQLNAREFEQAPGIGDRLGSLACCSSWRHKSWTWVNDWNELQNIVYTFFAFKSSSFSHVLPFLWAHHSTRSWNWPHFPLWNVF